MFFYLNIIHFYQTGQPYPPNDSIDFVGNEFYDVVDNRIINNFDHAWQSLKNSANDHTTMEIIIQTHREWSYAEGNRAFFRRPTEAEIWLQAFLALSRNFKGIHYYVYHSLAGSRFWGLVDQSANRDSVNPYYEYVAQLNDHLTELGPELLPITVDSAFTWEGNSVLYINNITGDSLDTGHRTIEVSIFEEYNNNDYFMLVNRRCSRDNSGTEAFPQHIDVTIDPEVAGTYQIRDLYSNELYITSDNSFRNIEILAGRGRVFELRRILDGQDETWANTVNICSDITVPSGRTLTISPNSTIKFHSGTELKLNGHLKARGTSSQHITFTSVSPNPTKGSWDWIRIENSSGNDTLMYCDIKYANIGV